MSTAAITKILWVRHRNLGSAMVGWAGTQTNILALCSVSGSLAVLSLLLSATSGRGSLVPGFLQWGAAIVGAVLVAAMVAESIRRVRPGRGTDGCPD
ncbi:hypothetical protein SAMN04487905_10287 [Actinopolyspora xinjiangensis]|uniref:Uncharacterized protein n=1 Tax=Actinopolyspora xinjiangensis TaxID=405564 RepID=A0A1H0Q660_9ACTN|nr:hypothetical protein SAMN04487905_10287 [Actinopolyspora xinjiangensis]